MSTRTRVAGGTVGMTFTAEETHYWPLLRVSVRRHLLSAVDRLISKHLIENMCSRLPSTAKIDWQQHLGSETCRKVSSFLTDH